jgi:hypothetical protein
MVFGCICVVSLAFEFYIYPGTKYDCKKNKFT